MRVCDAVARLDEKVQLIRNNPYLDGGAVAAAHVAELVVITGIAQN